MAKTLDEQLGQAQQVIAVLAEKWPQARAAQDRPALREMLQPLVQKITVRQDEIEYRILFRNSGDRSQSCDWPLITRTSNLGGLLVGRGFVA